MSDELPFDEKKLADELHDLVDKIIARIRAYPSDEYWAEIGRLQGDLSDVYRLPNTSVLRRKNGRYDLIFGCHHREARRDEVLVGLRATHIANGQFSIECSGTGFSVKFEPGEDRDVFIRNSIHETLKFTDERRKGWR